jgi:hypothetical protein
MYMYYITLYTLSDDSLNNYLILELLPVLTGGTKLFLDHIPQELFAAASGMHMP